MVLARPYAPLYKEVAKIILPAPHKAQEVFVFWEELFPQAQVLVAPAGTKVGKTFGGSEWILGSGLVNPGHYGAWIAPTLYKCRIAYRYMKAMIPDIEWINPKDGNLEIHMGNGSFIKFLHGRDAEVTVEGEAIDDFVVDEAGKQKQQLWFSLLTTITQTEGKGIITGTPRGRTWYYDLFQKALRGDPMLCHALLRTIDSPFVNPLAIERARRILPDALFRQYYLAEFVSDSQVYGDLEKVWRPELPVEHRGYWVHPSVEARSKPVVIGVDLAKRNDFTVFAAINSDGETVGYIRLRHKTYGEQVRILARFTLSFTGEDNQIIYDRTGLGDAVGEQISQLFDALKSSWTVTPLVFTNASKQEMVSRVIHAIDTRWWRCPRITRVEDEFVNLEVTTTKTGFHSYGHPSGEYDDVHWAFAMAISGAQAFNRQGDALDMIDEAMSGRLLTEDSEPADGVEEDDLPPIDDNDILDDIEEMA